MTETSKTQLDVPRTQSRESRSNSRQSVGRQSNSRQSQGRQSVGSRKGNESRRKSRGQAGGRRGSVYASDDDDESISGALGEHGFPMDMAIQTQQFIYSDEVQMAMQKLRERRQRKKKFKTNEVHIFHLPKIITSGTLPFVPSANFVKQTEEAKLPEPKAVPKLPRLRRTRQRTLLLDQTLADVLEEGRGYRRRATPLSRSLTKISLKGTPKTTPRTTPRAGSQRTTPKLETPQETPLEAPTKLSS